MGKYNSSVYRVRPLMEAIKKNPDTLNALLSLVNISGLGSPTCLRCDGIGGEKQLKPTKRHLQLLIQHMAQKEHAPGVTAHPKRIPLFYGTPEERTAACKNALALLDAEYNILEANSRGWYLFEGFTNPDIFIEGEDYVIICEGKWTESHITTGTTHLSSKNGEYRCQMIRHIQGALNYTAKKVYAFYIVDENCGYLDDLKHDALLRQLEQETIPLEASEKAKIADTFHGYTTWQTIAKEIGGIMFLEKKDIP